MITFDFYKVTAREMLAFVRNENKTDDDVVDMICKISGEPKEKIENLPWAEWTDLALRFSRGVANPNAEEKGVAKDGQ